MPPAHRPDAGVILVQLPTQPRLSVPTRRVLRGPGTTVRRAGAMVWHIWLFRFLLAWNLVLLGALIVMVMG